MNVFMTFLVLLLFAVKTEASGKETIGHTPSIKDNSLDNIPINIIKDKHSMEYIPFYPTSTSTRTYESELLPDGWFLQFYSNNLHVDLQSLHKINVIRDHYKLSFVKSDHYSADQGVHFMEAIQQTARDHIKVYADYWHGKMPSKNHKAYKITEDKMKQLRSDKNGKTYQLEARIKTTDGSLQMCCNMIINVKWEHGLIYSYHCAEPACFRINQRLDKEPCFYLNIDHGALDGILYQSCIKEIPFRDPTKANHHTSHPTTTATSSSHKHGVPHSSSVYAKTCQYDDTHDVEVTFLSKNLDLDGVILAYPKITRHQKLISFTKDTRIIDGSKLSDFNHHLEYVAMNHIEVYADVMHGMRDQTHIVTVVEKKNVGAATGMIYQVSANVRSSDAPHNEMCCNMLLHAKWHTGYDYEPLCAQVACFKAIKRAGTCAYLKIERQINIKDFKTCWIEGK